MNIGKFNKQADGTLIGTVDALAGHRKLTFRPNEGKGPDFTVVTESGSEAGAAWTRTSKDGRKSFISVKLDSPFLQAPIHAALFEQRDGSHALVWERGDRKAD